MQLYSNNLSAETKNDIAAFSRWLLDIGEGKIPAREDNETENSWIKIPYDNLLLPTENNLACIVQSTSRIRTYVYRVWNT
jgi:hypothetical protein